MTAQQQRVMRQQGINNPKPQMTWLHNMKKQIKKWKNKGKVILMVDANSGLADKDFAPFVAEVEMCDIIGGNHDMDMPNTQAEGSESNQLYSLYKQCDAYGQIVQNDLLL
eukprot:4668466-Ditylum_brightwellii.AAC.1